MDGFTKKTGSISDKAKKIARQVVFQEPTEVLKSAKTQILGETPQATGQNFSQQNQSESAVSEAEKQKIKKWEKDRLESLEKELEEERLKRQKQIQSWNEEQQALLQKPQEDQEQVLIEPKTKRKRGTFGMIQKKQGTKEMGKQVSG